MNAFRSCLALLAACVISGAFAQQPAFATLAPPQPTEAGKIEVTEFFWYPCSHCYAVEPAAQAWLKTKPADVVFKRIPVVTDSGRAKLAAIYYALEAMGLIEQLHPKLFEAFHKDHVNLLNDKARDDWLAKQGVDVTKFFAAANSFGVDAKVKRATELTRAYKVDGVPRVFVNGKYFTGTEFVGEAGLFPTVDQLIAKVRQGG